ncbi:MAG: hypothetical protein M1511_03080 [Deltaproteobacteria bacterium]|nr:hypothetical protein [Deltaproteobacteria bacterium]
MKNLIFILALSTFSASVPPAIAGNSAGHDLTRIWKQQQIEQNKATEKQKINNDLSGQQNNAPESDTLTWFDPDDRRFWEIGM